MIQITMEKKINKQLIWIKENRKYLSIYKIEQELELPEGTLKKFVDDRRSLPDVWHKPVIEWIKKFKK